MMFTRLKNRIFTAGTNDGEIKSPHGTNIDLRFFWLWAIILFVIVSVVSFSYISLTVKAIEDDVSRVHLEVARRAAAVIEDSLGTLIDAQNRLGLDMADPSRDKNATLALFMRAHPEFDNVSLITMKGTTILSRDRYAVVNKSEFKSYAGQANFLEALKGTTSVGSVFISNLGDPLITITTPVISLEGVVEGAIVADLDLKFMWKLVGDIQVGTNGKVYVVDQDGNLIADPDPSIVLQRENLLDRPVVKRVLASSQPVDGLDPTLRYVSNGQETFSTGLQISPYGWGVITEEPLAEALVASQRTQTAGAIFSVTVALMLLVLMIVIQRLITSNKLAYDANVKLDQNASLLLKREQDLIAANERLKELDKAKSEFISVAAHQLRTPLSAIKWTLSLLDENSGNLTPEQRSLLLKGYESNERIINLVNEMLVVTRIEAGKVQYKFSLIHLEDLVDSVILDFAGQAHARHITFTFERPATPFPYVNVDPDKIRDTIQNLIENAIRYTRDGGTIIISMKNENKFITVSIKDDGIGIPLQQQSSIFNKFFRADNAVKERTDGSGLGLFIAKSIVDTHGGNMGFESTEGKGSTFYFTIPCAPPPA
ncbi:Cache 3/Cache 2 fusion domain-containing protein [Patescibacteria group bacterium]|nr:Cache 3/Cache 2 fusion domain-containing protein [Patescibacteria group bacterium]